MSKLIDLTGQRYGRLRVVQYAGKQKFECICDCGQTTVVDQRNLKAGRTQSCGCRLAELMVAIGPQSVTHGETKGHIYTRLYATWINMKVRCLNPNNHAYADYGGRGITIQADWLGSYEAFRDAILAHLGPKPIGLSLDRIDNDGNYEIDNLRWATSSEQRYNQRPSQKRVTFGVLAVPTSLPA